MFLHYFVRAVSIDRVMEREALPKCVSRRTCRRIMVMLRVLMLPLTWGAAPVSRKGGRGGLSMRSESVGRG